MGIVRLGKQIFEVDEFRVVGNNLYLGNRVIEVCEKPYRVQVRGKDVSVDRLISNCDVLVEGAIEKSKVLKYLQVVGNILKYYVDSKRFFFNTTSKTAILEEKRMLKSKLDDNRRTIINIEGNFKNIRVEGSSHGFNEVWIRGNVSYVSCLNLSVIGNVGFSNVGEAMYVSKK